MKINFDIIYNYFKTIFIKASVKNGAEFSKTYN